MKTLKPRFSFYQNQNLAKPKTKQHTANWLCQFAQETGIAGLNFLKSRFKTTIRFSKLRSAFSNPESIFSIPGSVFQTVNSISYKPGFGFLNSSRLYKTRICFHQNHDSIFQTRIGFLKPRINFLKSRFGLSNREFSFSKPGFHTNSEFAKP